MNPERTVKKSHAPYTPGLSSLDERAFNTKAGNKSAKKNEPISVYC